MDKSTLTYYNYSSYWGPVLKSRSLLEKVANAELFFCSILGGCLKMFVQKQLHLNFLLHFLKSDQANWCKYGKGQ